MGKDHRLSLVARTSKSKLKQVFNRTNKPNPDLELKPEYSVMFFGDNSQYRSDLL